MSDTMTVRVCDRSTWGTAAPYPAITTVTIAVVCPVCGGPRGEAKNHNFHEDGQWLSVDKWDNPCGHLDTYTAVLREARAAAVVTSQAGGNPDATYGHEPAVTCRCGADPVHQMGCDAE